MWRNIVCRFGIPQSIINDNKPQFDSRVYINFCDELNIKNLYSTLWYPQRNDQAEASNKILLTTLKILLHLAIGKWLEELPGVLWAYRTTSRKPIRVFSFALTYRMEAILPIEVGMPRLRIEISEEANTKALAKDLDMMASSAKLPLCE